MFVSGLVTLKEFRTTARHIVLVIRGRHTLRRLALLEQPILVCCEPNTPLYSSIKRQLFGQQFVQLVLVELRIVLLAHLLIASASLRNGFVTSDDLMELDLTRPSLVRRLLRSALSL